MNLRLALFLPSSVFLFFLVGSALPPPQASGESGYEIRVRLKNYDGDRLMFAYYLAGKQYERAIVERWYDTFLQELQKTMIAEESTAWPGVSAPTFNGGLGFLYKWNMGWMHDTLEYMSQDPVHRKYHHNDLTFPLVYAYAEHYTLPLSHDEVVHGKGSLWNKMPGDDWQKAANLRLLYGHMVGHPGKKLLFMGQEFGQVKEWSHDRQLDWDLRDDKLHAGVEQWVKDVFHLYREHPALWNDESGGFEWIDLSDRDQSVVSYLRKDHEGNALIFVFNYTPVPRENYRIGVPAAGRWTERLNSDAGMYGGGDVGNAGGVKAEADPYHGRPYSISVTIPPLGVVILERKGHGASTST